MGRLNPCAGNDACNEDRTQGRACRRTHQAVRGTRDAGNRRVAPTSPMDPGNRKEHACVARRVLYAFAGELDPEAAVAAS